MNQGNSMQKTFTTAFALLLFLPPLAAIAEDTVHRDTDSGFAVTIPSAKGQTCGPGAYGPGYDTQFGCQGEMFKVVLLPWKSGGGDFELNVQTRFVRGGPGEILDRLAKALEEHGYQRIDARPADDGQPIQRIGFASEKRDTWYLLHGERLLEVNARFERDYREGEGRRKASAQLARIVKSITFL